LAASTVETLLLHIDNQHKFICNR